MRIARNAQWDLDRSPALQQHQLDASAGMKGLIDKQDEAAAVGDDWVHHNRLRQQGGRNGEVLATEQIHFVEDLGCLRGGRGVEAGNTNIAKRLDVGRVVQVLAELVPKFRGNPHPADGAAATISQGLVGTRSVDMTTRQCGGGRRGLEVLLVPLDLFLTSGCGSLSCWPCLHDTELEARGGSNKAAAHRTGFKFESLV